MLTIINGELRSETTLVDVTDSGFLYGDSLFETLRADGSTLIWAEQHLDRLETACKLCAIPFHRQQAKADLELASRKITWPAARVRLTLSRGSVAGMKKDHVTQGFMVVTVQPYTPPTGEQYQRGVDCIFAPNRRVNPVTSLPQLKRGNYADCLHAIGQARQKQVFEALFREPGGDLLEGAISNFFVLLDGILITPPAGELVLAGITRQQVIDAAGRLSLPVLEHPIHCDQLAHISEAFLTSSLFGLLPVRSIEHRNIPAGPIASHLREELGAPFNETE